MEIRRMEVEDVKPFIELMSRSYPGMKLVTDDDIEKMADRFIDLQQNDTSTALYGAYQSGQLVGGMRFHDFEMMFYDQKVPVGGIGMVAVDLLHKKERVAKSLLEYFHKHYLERETYMTALHPFRPDFYKKMGYGYGTKKNRYRVQPHHLPKGKSKAHIEYIPLEQIDAIVGFYNKVATKTHGMMIRSHSDFERPMKQPGNYTIGFVKDGEIKGYVGFSFQSEHGDSFLQNDILIHEMVYEDTEVLSEFLTFFHSQHDQVRSIYFDTQDEYFHHLLLNPSNGSNHLIPHVFHESNTQGVGLMYRILDTVKFLDSVSEMNFGGESLNLKMKVKDSFQPNNEKSVFMKVENGHISIKQELNTDVEIELDVSEFSTLLMGVVPFDTLVMYGNATISSKDYIAHVTRLFYTRQKPVCLNRF
ncbi:GNAT family N-acetyltransferase [Pseudalkalibacillus berkeleyi]|uniref:GNAT family N-acetyltransferase n=1 Tax=Pseudalkalibacillus berkeleyi TaxID=1069813 RepID=A0ABS9H5A0_9BACL|nr:GNAT family N-acetyltransferase [Pseudalkalibacillus berkeleyi]MCF6139012.1 GNAT family N-acetyltransferase [Pseudalkalibacillus berkeleyi]